MSIPVKLKKNVVGIGGMNIYNKIHISNIERIKIKLKCLAGPGI